MELEQVNGHGISKITKLPQKWICKNSGGYVQSYKPYYLFPKNSKVYIITYIYRNEILLFYCQAIMLKKSFGIKKIYHDLLFAYILGVD